MVSVLVALSRLSSEREPVPSVPHTDWICWAYGMSMYNVAEALSPA
jgi:hypothetical protein